MDIVLYRNIVRVWVPTTTELLRGAEVETERGQRGRGASAGGDCSKVVYGPLSLDAVFSQARGRCGSVVSHLLPLGIQIIQTHCAEDRVVDNGRDGVCWQALHWLLRRVLSWCLGEVERARRRSLRLRRREQNLRGRDLRDPSRAGPRAVQVPGPPSRAPCCASSSLRVPHRVSSRTRILTVCSDTEPSQSRRALPSVEHFVSCHPDSSLHKCSRILYARPSRAAGVNISILKRQYVVKVLIHPAVFC